MTSRSNTPVSVIVTAHETGRFIDDCLASITDSTHAALQIIVVNDGSTDDTAARLDTWATRDDRIEVHHISHRGRRGALELAHSLATSPVQCWVDSDDIVDPTAIARSVARLDGDHQLVYTHRSLIDENGERRRPDPRNRLPYQAKRLLVDNMIFHLRMFTTDLFEDAGGVGRLESAIDWDMNLRMTESTSPACVPRLLYDYRIRSGRMTARPDQIANGQIAVRNAIERRGLPYELVVDRRGWHLKKLR